MKYLGRRESCRNYSLLTLIGRGGHLSAGMCWNPAILWPKGQLLIFLNSKTRSGAQQTASWYKLPTLESFFTTMQDRLAYVLPAPPFEAQHLFWTKKKILVFPKIRFSWKIRYSMHVIKWILKVYGRLAFFPPRNISDILVPLNLRKQKQAMNFSRVFSFAFLCLVVLSLETFLKTNINQDPKKSLTERG